MSGRLFRDNRRRLESLSAKAEQAQPPCPERDTEVLDMDRQRLARQRRVEANGLEALTE